MTADSTVCPICERGHLHQMAILIVCAVCEKAWLGWEFEIAVHEVWIGLDWADEVRLSSVGSA